MKDNTVELFIESKGFGDAVVQVRRMSGRERLNELFELDLHVVVPRGVFDQDAVLANAPRLRLVQHDKEGQVVAEREIFGRVCSIRDLMTIDADHDEYILKIVPRAWATTLSSTSNLYYDAAKNDGLTLEEIFTMKLEESGLSAGQDFRFQLEPAYPPQEFVVQYQESDYAFIKRLTEKFGVYFYFVHESGKDVMVFTDRVAKLPELPAKVPFAHRGERSGVHEMGSEKRLVPSRFKVRDYNYRNPGVDVFGEQNVPGAIQIGAQYEYGSHVRDAVNATFLAGVRAQEAGAAHMTFRGRSDVMQLGAGTRFVVESDRPGDLPLVVVGVEHHLEQTTTIASQAVGDDEFAYKNRFEAIAHRQGIEYRPPRVTPRPVVSGVLTGVVTDSGDGNLGAFDELGRYRVSFTFDEADRGPADASRPIRMAQPSAGAERGFHLPLRKETEVVVSCVNGDPDRPIIVGAVPNIRTPSPVNQNSRELSAWTTNVNQIYIDDQDARVRMNVGNEGTILQLGAPSPSQGTSQGAPEDGALISTVGNWAASVSGWATDVSSGATALNTFKTVGTDLSHITWTGEPVPWVRLKRIEAMLDAMNAFTKAMAAASEGAFNLFVKKPLEDDQKEKEKAAQEAQEAYRLELEAAILAFNKYPASAKKRLNADGTATVVETEAEWKQRMAREGRMPKATRERLAKTQQKVERLTAAAAGAKAAVEDTKKEWEKTGYHVVLDSAKKTFDTLDKGKALAKAGHTLWSTISKLFAAAKTAKEYTTVALVHSATEKGADQTPQRRKPRISKFAPDQSPANVLAKPPKLPDPYHIIGCEHSIGLLAKDTMFLRAHKALTATSAGDVTVVAGEAAHIKAFTCVETAAHKVKSSASRLIDLHSEKKMCLVAHTGKKDVGDKAPDAQQHAANASFLFHVPDAPAAVVAVDDDVATWKIEAKDDTSMALVAEKGMKLHSDTDTIEALAKKKLFGNGETNVQLMSGADTGFGLHAEPDKLRLGMVKAGAKDITKTKFDEDGNHIRLKEDFISICKKNEKTEIRLIKSGSIEVYADGPGMFVKSTGKFDVKASAVAQIKASKIMLL